MLATLSTEDCRRLQAAQRVLLSPLDHEELSDWQAQVNHAVRKVVGSDQVFFVLLDDGEPYLCSDNRALKAEFRRRIEVQDSRTPSHRDRLLRQNWQRFEAMGAAAWHEQDLAPREQIERSPYYQEVCRPNGVRHTMGLAAPHLGGVLVTAFERPRTGFSEEGKARLQLLVPAFESGLRTVHSLHRRCRRLARMLDGLSSAVAVFDERGCLRSRNETLSRYLEEDRAGARVVEVMQHMASAYARRRQSGVAGFLSREVRTVETETACYRLRVAILPPEDFGEGGFLVGVDRIRLLPTSEQVRRRCELTPRQAEVALLLAEGLTDKEIAQHLEISRHTARRHTERVLSKLGLSSRAGVALALLRAH